MFSLLRNFLFLLPTETSHYFSLYAIKVLNRLKLLGLIAVKPAEKTINVMGLEFPHAVGLAAGLDKNADFVDSLGALGFGFIEVGTVTPVAQPGNLRPRLFRLPEAKAIINRMGFNNNGVDYLLQQVINSSYQGIIGINIGKNKDTPAEKAVDDYLICMRKVYSHASYITVNLSSPNTPGLRDLQFGKPLETLLNQLKLEQQKLAAEFDRYVPIAVKIAPDLADEDIEQVAECLLKYDIDGVIATNTTIARAEVQHLNHGDEVGGLSGAPLTESSTRVIEVLARVIREKEGVLPIIGVGGIMNGSDAAAKIKAGASLVQLYTGFIYSGPDLIRDSANEISRLK